MSNRRSSGIIKIALTALVAGTLSVGLGSCGNKVVYTKYETLPESGWAASNKLKFEAEISDLQSKNDVYILVRHADSYPYSNLFMFLTTEYPDGRKITDTIECVLANQKGQWKGDGAGDIWDNKIPLKKQVHFPQKGKYTFTFEQAMRTDPLPLIMDIGLLIEPSKEE